MNFRFVAAIILLAFSAHAQTSPVEPGVSLELAKWRAARYSDVRYKLNLTLEKMSPVLKGTMEIRVRVSSPHVSKGSTPASTESGPVTIILDWRKIKGSESLSTISNVSVNGTAVKNPVAIAPGSDSEHLVFDDGVVIGENVIKLDFTSPILTSGSAITRYVDKEDGAEYIYSLFVPSDGSTAFPVFDQPDLKARFTLQMDAPVTWGAIGLVSNSPEAKKTEFNKPNCVGCERRVITEFEETKPISTYVFAFAAGNFARAYVPLRPGDSNVPIRVFVRKSQLNKFNRYADHTFRLNREGIKYLEEYFDYKFPFPKYDVVLIPEFPFGGMEHAGATFLREDRVIFPTEPTKNDHITRANLIFHEAAHQWFGDTVTMKWFDDLWLKEGFAEFMAYKTLEKVMPEYNAWKIFYERNKQAAYLTDSTKGTTPIYQEIKNLNSAKSAYGNIVYRKAPSFLKQAEFYIGPDKFQTAVRAFLKKHEFKNAGWEDLVSEFEAASKKDLKGWAVQWVKQRGLPVYRSQRTLDKPGDYALKISPSDNLRLNNVWEMKLMTFAKTSMDVGESVVPVMLSVSKGKMEETQLGSTTYHGDPILLYFFPNYQDYGYGIFLLDDKSRDYVLKNIQNEKDDFLRTMMWGSLWDSVREAELAPEVYVELVIKNLGSNVLSSSLSLSSPGGKRQAEARTQNARETDESTIQTLLGRVSTAMTYYLSDVQRAALAPKIEAVLIEKMRNAPTLGQRITFYRAFLNIASTENARGVLKSLLAGSVPGAVATRSAEPKNPVATAPGTDKRNPDAIASSSAGRIPLKTKDRFDIVTRLLILGDPDASALLAGLEKTETSDEAKRYAYSAKAGIATAENKAKFWNDFTANKDISESWIEAAFGPFNSPKQADLTLPYLEKALAELPNLKRSRKIFFVNGWLAAFIGGQRSEQALGIVNKFLADNPNLDKDLRLKILENVDLIERAVKIRGKFGKN
ncbi:MAG: M1 family aminopeptidase [Pyrinomonadaceae bacterium]